MSWTSADLDAFDAELKARGSVTGLTSVSGESVTFASLEDAMKFRAMLAGLVGASSSPPRNIRYAVTDKGV
jgi:hypothetical protein